MATKMNRLLLSQSGFQRRVLTVLQHMGLATLEDLAAQTESGLLRSARFGRKSLKDVKEVLATHGMTLQKESVSTKSVEARLDEARLEVHRL